MAKPDDELTDRVTELETKLAEAEADIAMLTTRVDALEIRVIDLEQANG